MKRIFIYLTVLFICFSACSKDNDDSGNSDEIVLPPMTNPEDVCTSMKDANFMSYCYQNFDINDDKKVSVQEALLAKVIEIDDVSDLTGIQYFSNLETIRISKSHFSTIDLRPFKGLIDLRLEAPLTDLDIRSNQQLNSLSLEKTSLHSLDLTNNSMIKTLKLIQSQLDSLDISNLKNLEVLLCNGCQQLRTIRMMTSQLKCCEIDDVNNINFYLIDKEGGKPNKTAQITYSFIKRDYANIVDASICIKADGKTIDSGLVKDEFTQVIDITDLPNTLNYSVSAYKNSKNPNVNNEVTFRVSLGFNLTIKVDIYLEGIILLNSYEYNCFPDGSWSFYHPYSFDKDYNSSIKDALDDMIKSLCYKTIDIDVDGNVVATQ